MRKRTTLSLGATEVSESDLQNEEQKVEGVDATAESSTGSDVSAEADPAVETEVAVETPKVKKVRVRKTKPVEAQPEKMKKEPPPEEVDPNYVPGSKKQWYVLKVQVNREESIRDALRRRIAIDGKEAYFGDILIPTEKVTEVRGGKKRVVKKKLYPGYLMIHVEVNEETWFLVRDTAGVGDFTGATGKPTPMMEHEIQAILRTEKEETAESPKLKIAYQVGDKIKVKEGTFENFEGEVYQIDMGSGRVTVMINIFGRSTPVELEYWQIETPN